LQNGPRQRAIIALMKSARSTKQKHEVPWTLVASAKRATPRLVLVSRFDANPRRSKPNNRARGVDTSQVGRHLEQAFIRAVKTAKRNAGKA
jgi:hypothetical protein